MKNKIHKYCRYSLVVILSLFGLYSCQDTSDLELPRIFQPVNFSCSLDKTVATISWSQVDSAKSYTLILSTDSINYSNPVIDTTLTEVSCKKELAGETKYFAKIRANALDPVKTSKFNSKLSFKTPAENIFLGYGTNINTGKIYSAYMTGINTLTVKWTPKANVSHLILTSSDGSTRDSLLISQDEALVGKKVISSLPNSNWKIKVYNNKVLRGTTYGMIEGDIVLKAGDDLLAALTKATSGQVILLDSGVTFPIGGSAYNFDKNLKIRCISPISRSVVCMTAGTPTATANMFGVALNAAIDSLVFENIDFSGYCNNSTSSTKIGYLFNNKASSTVKNLAFNNCKIHNLGNTPMRLSGGTAAASQHITNLVFNGCIINESGFASGYAIINISKSFDFIDNITIANSTLYNFSYPVISIVQTVPTIMNSVKIANCTFNQTSQNTGGSRVLFTFDFMTITSGVSISNCVFGTSGTTTAGVKITNPNSTAKISGSYYCSDYVDETLVATISYSIKGSMTPYSGKSTALWVDPINGNFNLLDTGFAGKGTSGDLRTY